MSVARNSWFPLFLVLTAFVILILSCGDGGGGPTEPDSPGSGSLSVTVTSAGVGLNGVTVSLSGPTTRSGTTNSSGVAAFQSLSVGSYSVTISGFSAEVSFSSTTKSASVTSGGSSSVTFQGNPVDYTLTVALSEGVTGTPPAGQATYPPGTTVDYAYDVASTHQDLGVYVDDVAASSSGTVVMSGERRLVALASPIPVVPPEVQVEVEELAEDLAGVTTGAATPMEAYRSVEAAVEALEGKVPLDSIPQILALARLSAFSVEDAPAIAQALQEISDSLAAQPAGSAAEPSPRSSSSSEIVFLYVNGLQTTFGGQQTTLRKYLPAVVHTAGYGNRSQYPIEGYFNPQAIPQSSSDLAALICLQREADALSAGGQDVGACAGRLLSTGGGSSLQEAYAQVLSRSVAPSINSWNAEALADRIEDELEDARVVLVTHSQGAQVASEAFGRLASRPGINPQCIGTVALGPPVPVQPMVGGFGPSQLFVTGANVRDALLTAEGSVPGTFPGIGGVPASTNPRSDFWNQRYQDLIQFWQGLVSSEALTAKSLEAMFAGSIDLHGIERDYLTAHKLTVAGALATQAGNVLARCVGSLHVDGPDDGQVNVALPSMTVRALGPGGSTAGQVSVPVTVSLGNNPSGATLSGTRVITTRSGVATFSDLVIDQAGEDYTLVVSVPGGVTATSEDFDVRGLPAPRITTTSLSTGTVGQSYSQTVRAEDGTTPYAWSISSGTLPAGLTFIASTGVISGTPTMAGTSNFTVMVTDANSLSDTEELGITVEEESTGTYDCSTQTEIPTTECEALVAFHDNTGGSGWTTSTDWLETATPCGWYGVTCVGGSVSQLAFDDNNLTGSLSSEIGNLTNLTWLELEHTQITGPIPPEIGNLSNLQRINFHTSQFSGSIPPEMGNLSSLTHLLLEENQLSGPIPPELGNLASLTRLYLQENQLTGSIPSALGSLASLESFDASRNLLSGSIPSEIGNITGLFSLWLSDNQLSGSIPSEFGALTNLAQFSLPGNQLTGTIPSWLGNLTNLEGLRLNGNQFTGAIPSDLGSLVNLWTLELQDNQLSGSIPATFGNLSTLDEMNLSNNQLSGSIPLELGNLALLRNLNLSSNQLSGPLPAELGNLTDLSSLHLQGNAFSGMVPLPVAERGGRIDGYSLGGDRCVFVPPGNSGLLIPDTPEYQATDLNSDGVICGLSLGGTPVIQTTSLPDGTVGLAYSQTVSASGGTTPYTWSISVGTLPAGLTIDVSTGEISGTPTADGTSEFTVLVTDSGSLTDTQDLSIAINAALAPPTITTASLNAGTVGQEYGQTVSATGGTTPYTWAISAETLPSGLTLDTSTGVISGTPTMEGESAFTIQVTDAGGLSDTQDLSIFIGPAPVGPTITTTSLSDGTVGLTYGQTLEAMGGTTPYTWSISAGTLPAGLSLDTSTGVLSGIPTTEGTSAFTVLVLDAESVSDSRELSISITTTPILTLGSLVSGSIDAPGETDFFTFTGSAGDIIALTVVETPDWGDYDRKRARVTLLAPGGEQVDQFDSNTQRHVTLPGTGSYLLRVTANNLVSMGAYNLGMEGITPMSPGPTPIALGDLLSGSIDASGEADFFTFTGSAGDIIALTVVETPDWGDYDRRRARVTLFTEAGEQVDQFDSDIQRHVTLPGTGNYLLRVTANNLVSMGAYNLGMEGITPMSPGPTPIALGDLLSGSIDASGEADFFTFTGSAGDIIALTVVETPDWGDYDRRRARVTLFTEAGEQVDQFDSDIQRHVTLPGTGNYLLRVTANNLVSMGAYNLGMEGITPMSPGPTPIALGDLLSGSIDASGEADFFTFTGSAGDIIALTVVETPDWGDYDRRRARVTLFTEAGEQVDQFDSDIQRHVTLPGTGNYLLRVTANNLVSMGAYNLGMEGITPMSPGPTPIALGDLLSGSIDASGEADFFTFTGSAGDIIALTVVETPDWGDYDRRRARVTLFTEAGEQVDQFDSDIQRHVTLPGTGNYLLRVTANNLVSMGAYNLGMEGITPMSPGPTPIALGDLLSGSIDASGEADFFTFTGSAGDIIALTVVETPDWGDYDRRRARVTLFTEAGEQVDQFDSDIQRHVTLPGTGNYLLRVTANNLVSMGAYNLGMEGITPMSPGPTPIALGDLLSGSIDASGEADFFTFTGSAGDIIALTVVETPDWGDYDRRRARVTLFTEAGEQVDQFDSDIQRHVTLPGTGNYLLRVTANNLVSMGAYNLGMEGITPMSPGPTPIALGDLLSGSIDASGEADFFTFTGTYGDVIVLTITETPDWGDYDRRRARVTLFTEAGEQVDQFDSDIQQQITLPGTGNYLLRVTANNLVSTGVYGLGLALPVVPGPEPTSQD